jgi:hypothetical protein
MRDETRLPEQLELWPHVVSPKPPPPRPPRGRRPESTAQLDFLELQPEAPTQLPRAA